MLNDKNRAKEESRANLLRKEEYKNIQELISVITSHLKPEKKMQTPPSPKKERESEFKYSFQGILLILITLKH